MITNVNYPALKGGASDSKNNRGELPRPKGRGFGFEE